MQNHPTHHTHQSDRPDLGAIASKAARSASANDRPMGFSRRELRRLVAEMIG